MPEQAHDQVQQSSQNSLGCLIRTLWMIIGNLILAVLFLVLVKKGKEFTAIDIVYWAIVGILIWLRYVDIHHFEGHTSNGTSKADRNHWLSYCAILISVSLSLWALAHGIAKYLLP